MTIEHRLIPQEANQIPSENIIEEIPQVATSHVLRPKIMTRVRALAAAGLVGLGGAVTGGDAEAQQYGYSTSVYPGQQQTAQIHNGRELAVVMGAQVLSNVLRARNESIQRGTEQKGFDKEGNWIYRRSAPDGNKEFIISRNAQEVMKSLGLRYDVYPFCIDNPKDPNPANKFDVKSGTTNISVVNGPDNRELYVKIRYVRKDNGAIFKGEQKVVLGLRNDGGLESKLLGNDETRVR